MARNYDAVVIDKDKLRADIKAMGITLEQVGETMGKAKNYLSSAVLAPNKVARDTINKVERTLFKPLNTYVIEEKEVESTPKAVDETVLKHLDTHLFAIEKQIKALDEERLNNIEANLLAIEQQIKSTNTWLARLYAVWTKEEKDA